MVMMSAPIPNCRSTPWGPLTPRRVGPHVYGGGLSVGLGDGGFQASVLRHPYYLSCDYLQIARFRRGSLR